MQVLADLPSGGLDEGRGMAEIVHDVAPGRLLPFTLLFWARPILPKALRTCKAPAAK